MPTTTEHSSKTPAASDPKLVLDDDCNFHIDWKKPPIPVPDTTIDDEIPGEDQNKYVALTQLAVEHAEVFHPAMQVLADRLDRDDLRMCDGDDDAVDAIECYRRNQATGRFPEPGQIADAFVTTIGLPSPIATVNPDPYLTDLWRRLNRAAAEYCDERLKGCAHDEFDVLRSLFHEYARTMLTQRTNRVLRTAVFAYNAATQILATPFAKSLYTYDCEDDPSPFEVAIRLLPISRADVSSIRVRAERPALVQAFTNSGGLDHEAVAQILRRRVLANAPASPALP